MGTSHQVAGLRPRRRIPHAAQLHAIREPSGERFRRGFRAWGGLEQWLARTYVILVPPKCLLTWGYVEVDAAAFCLQHDDRHGESAGPVEILIS